MAPRGGGRSHAMSRASSHPLQSSESSRQVEPSLSTISVNPTTTAGVSRDVTQNDVTSQVRCVNRLLRSSDGRLVVTIENTVLVPHFEIAASMTNSFQADIDPPGYNWRNVTKAVKESYFEAFQKLFTWDPSLNAIVRKKWYQKAGTRYKDFVSKIKAKGKQPDFIRDDIWAAWKAYWAREDVKLKSAQAKRNRLSEPRGVGTRFVTHHGGSRCAHTYAAALAKEKGIPIEAATYETFKKFHYKNGKYTCLKAQQIDEEVERRFALACESMPCTIEEQQVIKNKIYLEVAMDEWKKVFGTGCMYELFTTTSDGDSAGNFQNSTMVNERLSEMQTQLDERQKREEELEELLRKQADVQVQMQAQMQQMMEFMGSMRPSPQP